MPNVTPTTYARALFSVPNPEGVIIPVTFVGFYKRFFIGFVNPTGSGATLTARVQYSDDGNDPWDDWDTDSFLAVVENSQRGRRFTIDSFPGDYVRVLGVSSGGAFNAYRTFHTGRGVM